MNEKRFSIHMHTHYSDGNATHQDLVQIAADAGLDGIITTDHNIWLSGLEGYYGEGKKKTMLLIGEEVHDRTLSPPGNHMLVINAQKEMAPFADNPQRLIDQVNRANGLTFLAHPIEDSLEMFNQDAFDWRDWHVDNYTGIELWNHLSEFKSTSRTYLSAAVNAIFPQQMALGPLERTLSLWDDLISTRKKPVVAIGGVDAHRFIKKLGPLSIDIYPYKHHFRSVTTHILTQEPFTGSFAQDKRLALSALKQGHCFVAYDLPSPTEGFRFSVHNDDGQFIMGDQVNIKGGLTFQIRLPQKTLCRLLKDGRLIKEWTDRDVCTHITKEEGAYRVEVFIPYKGRLRGWIFSNPIYVWG